MDILIIIFHIWIFLYHSKPNYILGMKPADISSDDGAEFLEALNGSTRNVYRAALGWFLNFYRSEYGSDKTLEDFLDALDVDMHLPRRKRRRVGRNLLRKFVDWCRSQGYSAKTIRTYVSAVQSFASYFGYNISTRYVKLPSSQPASKKFPWTVDKVGEFVEMIRDLQLKSIAATLFQSGLSVSDLLRLTYKDIKYEYERGITPLCLDFERKKTDVPFMTFAGSYAIHHLKKYLRTRGRLKPTDKLYTMPHRTIDHYFKKYGRKMFGEHTGFNPARPHSLRAAFRTILDDAGMAQDDAEFFMGHKLPEQRRVYLSRTREGWRELYKRYENALTPASFIGHS